MIESGESSLAVWEWDGKGGVFSTWTRTLLGPIQETFIELQNFERAYRRELRVFLSMP
jgi:hypothetical protein